MTSDSEFEVLRAERDLYRSLLELGTHDDLPAFLDEALALIVNVTQARRGWLAIDARAGGVAFSSAQGFSADEIEAVRSEISSGIMSEALRTGQTVSTASALDDPRFRTLASVQARKIQAVLCAPIGGRNGIGVLYLQGRDAPGPFPERERTLAETFALRIAPLAERLARQRSSGGDATRELRARLQVERLVGSSRALAESFRQIAVAAGVDATVLITGESGTGKTEIARSLHESSRRAPGPFVEINCAALPETLFEAELFGAEKGAHSTATRRMPGKIASAQGGTLFLDEIGEVPLAAQAKLLQFVQSKRYFRLGSDAPLEADVRIVAATNADLELAVREKRFREDLFYRINVLTVRAPSLRERPEDIGPIAEHLASVASAASKRPMTLTFAALSALSAAEWPGNVRQLAAAVQRGAAFALDEGSDVIDARHLFPGDAEAAAAPVTFQDATRVFQRRFLREALDQCNGNVSETARRLGLARSHLHELLRAHGLTRARS